MYSTTRRSFFLLIKEGHWEYANRTNASGAALIVAVTSDAKLLLVEQYRIPVHARTIELPAGLIGDDAGGTGEKQEEAARRELIEETGYAAGHMELLTTGPASAGMTSELMTFVAARQNLKRMDAHSGGVDGEEATRA